METILSKCIDEYKSLRLQQEQATNRSTGIFGAGSEAGAEDSATKEIFIDPKMENIIEQMFQRCYRDHCFEQAIGTVVPNTSICIVIPIVIYIVLCSYVYYSIV